MRGEGWMVGGGWWVVGGWSEEGRRGGGRRVDGGGEVERLLSLGAAVHHCDGGWWRLESARVQRAEGGEDETMRG